jgi:glycine/D-amino acid oxidase-like deaminating enzyme
MGMDIIEQCEVKGVTSANGVVTGVQTTRGDIACGKLAIVVAGHSSVLAEMAGFRLPSNPPAPGPCLRADQALHGRGGHGQHRHGYMSQSTRARW